MSKKKAKVYSVDFRDGKFVFAHGGVFPRKKLPDDVMALVAATGSYVAYQVEITRRIYPEFDKLLDTEKGREVVAQYLARWTREALEKGL